MTLPFDSSSLSSAEKGALIARLWAQIEELNKRLVALKKENAALRAKLKLPPKTPDNSNTPPSQGDKSQGANTQRPKSNAHPGAYRPLHPKPTQKRDILASHCPHCQTDISGVAQEPVHAYDRIEIPEIKPDITRVTLHGGTCPCGAKQFRAEPLVGLEPGAPFGPNLRAFAIYLRFTHAISFERLARLMSDLLGVEISEGALVNMLNDTRPAFARQASLIRARLLFSSILQSDETSVRVGKRTWWNWVFHHGDDCCFVIRPSRGKVVVAEFLGDFRPEFWVSDRLAAQIGWGKTNNQFCLAHLIRDARYAIEAGDTAFAPKLLKLLQKASRIAGRRDRLADTTLRTYAYKLATQLDGLLRIKPTHSAGEKLREVIKGAVKICSSFSMTEPFRPPTTAPSRRCVPA